MYKVSCLCYAMYGWEVSYKRSKRMVAGRVFPISTRDSQFNGGGAWCILALSLGLQVPSEKVFGVGARRVQIPSEEVLGGVGYV